MPAAPAPQPAVPVDSPIRVLAVDDSVVVRRAVAAAVDSHPAMELVATAANGRIALDKLDRYRPDVIVLDLEMPELDGLATLEQIRIRSRDLPVVIFSHVDVRQSGRAMDALSDGVTEFVLKPSAADGIGLAQDYVRTELLPVVQQIARSTRWPETTPLALRAGGVPAAGRRSTSVGVIGIAVSTGGPDALATLVSSLPSPLPIPTVVVQHMPRRFTALLAQRLDQLGPAVVREAESDEPLTPGTIYIAPGGRHTAVRAAGGQVQIELHDGPKENFCRPSADVLFRSLARTYGEHALGLVLTGMGEDGKRGARDIAAAGGIVLAQSAESATVASMPRAVAGFADAIVPLPDVARLLARLTGGPVPQ